MTLFTSKRLGLRGAAISLMAMLGSLTCHAAGWTNPVAQPSYPQPSYPQPQYPQAQYPQARYPQPVQPVYVAPRPVYGFHPFPGAFREHWREGHHEEPGGWGHGHHGGGYHRD